MYYVSTRNKGMKKLAAEAIAQGLSRDGGLFTPEVFPKLSPNALETMREMSYQQRAVYVMKPFLDDFTVSELTAYAKRAPPAPSRTWRFRCWPTCSPAL